VREHLHSGLLSLFFIVLISKLTSSLMLVGVDLFAIPMHEAIFDSMWSTYTGFVALAIALAPALFIAWQTDISLKKKLHAGVISFLLSFFFAIILFFFFLYLIKTNSDGNLALRIPPVLAFYAPLFFCVFFYISMQASLYALPLPLRPKKDTLGNKIRAPKVYKRGIFFGMAGALIFLANGTFDFLPIISPTFSAMPFYIPYIYCQLLILYLLFTQGWKFLRIAYIGSCLSFFFISGHEDIFWRVLISIVFFLQFLCIVHLYHKDSEEWVL